MAGKKLKRKQSESEIIYDLISKRQLKKIQKLMKSLNIQQRQAIVARSVKKESLLYHACAIGCKNIVKYLVVECGADVEQRGRLGRVSRSPLFIAVWNKHSSVVKTLVKLGADVNTKDFCGTNIVSMAWDNKQLATAKFLVEHGATINSADNMRRSIRNTDYIRFLLTAGIDVNLTDELGRHALIHAAEVGQLPVVKLLLHHNADIHHRDNSGDNALSVAIYNNQHAIRDLLMSSGYTEKDMALTLEFLGCKHVIFVPRLRLAIKYWLMALKIRHELASDIDPLSLANVPEGTIISLGQECQTSSQLIQMRLDLKTMQFQALTKLIRIFGAQHQITTKAFVGVSISLIFRNDFETSFCLIEQVLLFNKENQEPVLVLDFFRTVLDRFKSAPRSDFDQALHALKLLLGFIGDKELVQQSQLNPFRCRCSADKYYDAMLLFLELVNLILEQQVDAAEDQGLQMKVAGAVHLNKRASLKTTLLHAAVFNRFPARLVSLLVQCGANVNATDESGNTPLHYVSEATDDESKRIARFLLDKGSHADTVNRYGHCPLSSLLEKRIIKDPLDYLTLQCLAARVICEKSIPYKDQCPKVLTPFVERHGIYGQNKIKRVYTTPVFG